VSPAEVQLCAVELVSVGYAKFDYLGGEFRQKLLLQGWIGLGAHYVANLGA
jgi:hypothetical protein